MEGAARRPDAGGSRGEVGQPELEYVCGPADGSEVIGSDDGEPPSHRARDWLRAHPRTRAGLAVLTAIGSVAGLTAVARAGVRQVQGPQAPPLAVTVTENRSDVSTWSGGPQGRPDGPPTMPLRVTVRRSEAGPVQGSVQVSVLGISGPGLVDGPGVAVDLPSGPEPTSFPLSPRVDCDAVPTSPNPSDYRLRLAVRSGSRTAGRTTPAGRPGAPWLDSLTAGCDSWRARRDLTVTAVAARVDPRVARTTLTLVVTNTGDEPALLGPTRSCCGVSIEPTAPLRVAPLSAASADFTVVLDTCDTVSRPVSGAAPLTTNPRLSTEIGLAGLAGPRLPADLTGFEQVFDPYSEGFGPTGVVFGRDAAVDLEEALTRACGGLGPMVTLLSPGSVRFDRRTGLLDVEVTIDVTPGKVRSLRLTTQAPAGTPGDEYLALWTSTGPLRPDRTGQVRTVLHYQVPGHRRRCLSPGGFLPLVTATLEVPDAGTVRQVRYSGLFDLAEDPRAIPQLCSEG